MSEEVVYKRLEVPVIRSLVDSLTESGDDQSVRSMVRLLYEQTLERRMAGAWLELLMVCSCLGTVGIIVSVLEPAKSATAWTGMAVLGLICFMFVFARRHQIPGDREEAAEIRTMILDGLAVQVRMDHYAPVALDKEERQALKSALRATRRDDPEIRFLANLKLRTRRDRQKEELPDL